MKFTNLVKAYNVKHWNKHYPDWKELEEKIKKEGENEKENENASDLLAKVLGKRKERNGALGTISSTCTPPCSSTLSSSSIKASTASTNRRRKALKTYITENEPPTINLNGDCEKSRWARSISLVNGVSVTERLLQYRNQAIEYAKEGLLETYQEELALNSIILIDGVECAPNSRLQYGFSHEEWDRMLKECKDLYPVENLELDVKSTIFKFAEVGNKDFNSCKNIIKELPDDAENNECIELSMRIIAEMYKPKSSNKAGKQKYSFSIDSVYPVFLPFFDETDLTTRSGTDGQAQVSEERCGSIDGSKGTCRFSDLSINFSFGSMPEQGLAIVEIKPPEKVRNGSRPDFIKLANEMKDSIDKMVNDGMDDADISVVGVLVEGFKCTMFVMDLKYQATYRLIPLSIFYLPRSRQGFYVLPFAYESLAILRKMTYFNANKCHAFHLKKKRLTVRNNYVVKSYDSSKNRYA
ncbi:hypothetical protein BDC45DRAFT_606962 [Circinella umbellata]|nr:hypothetical protein BDC45DRAFT_606962 [Circinella umbellata]